MTHNGGRSQVNFWFLEFCGCFPFINHLKAMLTDEQHRSPGLLSTLDSNGYPLTLTGGAYRGLCDIPTATEYTGHWILDWLGTGTLQINTAVTTVSGRLSGTNGRYTFTNKETTVGNGINFNLQIVTTSARDPIRQLRLYRADQTTNLTNGETWNPVFINKLIAAKIGVLRFMDWEGEQSEQLSLLGRPKAHDLHYLWRSPLQILYLGWRHNRDRQHLPRTWPCRVLAAQ